MGGADQIDGDDGGRRCLGGRQFDTLTLDTAVQFAEKVDAEGRRPSAACFSVYTAATVA